MSLNVTIGIVGLVLLIVLLLLRVHVGIALWIAGLVGIGVMVGVKGALNLVAIGPYALVASFHWAVIPLFILMGMVIFYSGISDALFKAADLWIGKLTGGMILATMLAAGAFASACGSSAASTAVFTKSTLPEMLRRGYNKGLSAGCIAASGTLAIMIPPSGALVFYALFVEQSVGKLQIAGILPGLLSLAMFLIMVVIRCSIDPTLAPKREVFASWGEKVGSLKYTWGVPAIFLIVIGGMFFGVFSATEGGAIGCFAAILIGLSYRQLSRHKFTAAVVETVRLSSVIVLLLTGALIFSRFVTLSGIPKIISEFVAGKDIPVPVVFTVLMLMYLFLGMFMEGLGMMAVTLPFVYPLIVALGFSPIWWGIIIVKQNEIALMTPPVGLGVFVVKGIAGDSVSLTECFRGISWFVVTDIVTLMLLLVFPQISLLLPNMMR